MSHQQNKGESIYFQGGKNWDESCNKPRYSINTEEGYVMTQVKETVNHVYTLIYGQTFRAQNSLYPYPQIAALNPFFLETPIF